MPQFDVVGVGLNATDTLIVVPRFPAYAGKAPIQDEIVMPGGQVASALAACARLGLRTKYIGAVGDDPRIEVRSFDGLLVDFVRQVGGTMLVRGLRYVSDFEYEYQMALMNRKLAPEIETVFLAPAFDHVYVSSSLVREVARFGGDVTALVHPRVAEALQARFPKR